MKKLFTLLSIFAVFSTAGFGQAPNITYQTAWDAGKVYGITVAAVSGSVDIDWGNGVRKNYTVATSGTGTWIETMALGPDAVVKFYGEIVTLRAGNNQLSAIDVTNCPTLDKLEINAAKGVTSIDVTQNPLLKTLVVFGCSKLTSLDVSQNPELYWLTTQWTNITTLDLTNNPKLEVLLAGNMPFLENINVTKCPLLRWIECFGATEGGLQSLDISGNPALTKLLLYDNNISACALDDIYCNLPEYSGGILQVFNEKTPIADKSPDTEAAISNTKRAADKGWIVQKLDVNGAPATFAGDASGCPSSVCETSGIFNLEVKKLEIVPNPVRHAFRISFPDNAIVGAVKYAIIDISGKKMMEGEVSGNEEIDVKNLASGVYFIKADNYFGKIVKK